MNSISGNKSTVSKLTNTFYAKLLVIVVLLCLVELLRASQLQGFTRAETCFAEGAREMFLDKQYIAPLLHQDVYFDKPPLHYWFIIWFYQIFGVSLLTARAVSAVAAALTVVTSALFLRMILGEATALLASMILSTTIGFYELGSIAMPDMLLCLFDTIAIFCAYKVFLSESKFLSLSLYTMTISLALGWMTKGPIAILIPAIAVAITLIIFKQPLRIPRKELAIAVLIFFLLLIPWHWAVYHGYGAEAFGWLYLRGNIKRFVGLDPSYNFGHSPGYITMSLLTGFLPWTFFLVPGMYKCLSFLSNRANLEHRQRFLIFMCIWALCNTLFFSLSWSNWCYYSLPIYPALSAITAYFLFDIKHKISLAKLRLLSAVMASGFFITTIAYALLFLPAKAKIDRYLNFADQVKRMPTRVPFFFHGDLNGQYLIIDHIVFETGRMPVCCDQEKLEKMAYSFQPFVVLLPKHNFEELPLSCQAKFKIIEIEQTKWINFPNCKLVQEAAVGKPASLILASHRCQLPVISSENLIKYRYERETSSSLRRVNASVSHLAEERKNTEALATSWLAKAYFTKPTPPDVVVIGNAQVGSILGADAFVDNKRVDLAGDHRSSTIEHDLKLLLHKQWHTFIAPLPGGMISDQFIASRALFSGKFKPKFVVVMLSPVEFIDILHPEVKSTESFATFSKYLRNDVSLDKRSLDASLGKSQLLPNDYFESTSPLALSEPLELICPGEVVITSCDGYFFEDDSPQYKVRYKNPFSPQLTMQMHYLDALFKYLKEQNIPVAAVELPLTNANHILLPESFWQFYKKRIGEICNKYDVDYWDTESIWNDFPKTEFCDSLHLGLRGGLKLTRPIVLATAYKFHFPMYAYNGNFGPLVPGKEKTYFHKSWAGQGMPK